MKRDFEKVVLFEHRFWLQILGDHARLILDALSPVETAEIQRAKQFIAIFDQLLNRANRPLSEKELVDLTNQAYQSAQEIRSFKLELIQRHLIGKIKIELTPTLLNHAVNEVEEYLRILGFLLSVQVPPILNPIHHHLLWLEDASGHAAVVTSKLDEVEEKFMAQGKVFYDDFKNYHRKAVEIAGYMRTKLEQFPALSRLNIDAEIEVLAFSDFLGLLLEMKLSNQLLGTMQPLLLDHFLREECYFLNKLAQSADIKMPNCDPARPRIENN